MSRRFVSKSIDVLLVSLAEADGAGVFDWGAHPYFGLCKEV